MIEINYINGNYVARANFEDKDKLKSNGFFWDRLIKKWYAPTAEVAYRLIDHCLPETKKRIISELGLNDYTFKKENIKWPKDKTPYAHQIAGAHFALTRRGSYLAFEAGTGKTATSIMCINSKPGKTIIICPAFLKYNWQNELNAWLTHAASIQIINSSKTEIDLKHDIFILPTSLLHVSKVRGAFFTETDFKLKWLIIDEAHYFKSETAKRTISLLGGKTTDTHTSKNLVWKGFHKISEHVVNLSGTPMPNRPIELYPIVSKHAPHAIEFLSKHNYGLKYCNAHEGEWGWDYSGHSNLAELNSKLTQNFMSVKKLEECVDLPDKLPNNLIFLNDPSPKILKMESTLLGRVSITELVRLEAQRDDRMQGKIEMRGGMSAISENALSYMSELRHLTGLKKVEQASQIILEMSESSEHLLIFGWHNDVIEQVAARLRKQLSVSVITGQTPHKTRQAIVDDFQTSKTQKVLVANIQAAGVGITLTKAFRPVFIEPSWVPSDNDQAISRVHRIGQTKKVQATFLVWPNSIDHLILNAHKDKSFIINEVIKSEPN